MSFPERILLSVEALSKLAVAIKFNEYEASPAETEALGRIRMSNLLKESSAFVCGAIATYHIAGRSSLVSNSRWSTFMKVSLAYLGGLPFERGAAFWNYGSTASQLLQLDSPVGAEMEAIIKESDAKPAVKKLLLSSRRHALPGGEVPSGRICVPEWQLSEKQRQALDEQPLVRSMLAGPYPHPEEPQPPPEGYRISVKSARGAGSEQKADAEGASFARSEAGDGEWIDSVVGWGADEGHQTQDGPAQVATPARERREERRRWRRERMQELRREHGLQLPQDGSFDPWHDRGAK